MRAEERRLWRRDLREPGSRAEPGARPASRADVGAGTSRSRALARRLRGGDPFLDFPHPWATRVLDLGWLLAWLAPACLVLGARAAWRRVAPPLKLASRRAGSRTGPCSTGSTW